MPCAWFAWLISQRSRIQMRGSFIDRMLLPTIVGLSTFVFALILLQRLLTQQNADIHAATQTHALFVKNKLESELEARILPLELLGELWQVRVQHEDPDMEVEFAATLVRSRYPVYQAIEWADPSYRLRWVLPEEMRKSESSDLVSDARRRSA